MSFHARLALGSAVQGGNVSQAGFRRIRRIILSLRLGLTLAILVAAVALAWYQREHHIKQAHTYADGLVVAMADHTRASLQSMSQGLEVLADEGIQKRSDAEALNLLRRQLESQGGTRALFLIGSDGRIRAHTKGATGDALDRDFWRALSQPTLKPLFLGHRQPGLGKLSDILPLALRLQDGKQFAGIVGAALEPAYFLGFFQSLHPQYEASFTLLRQGEPLIESGPQQEEHPDITALRLLPEYGLELELHVSEAAILAEVRREVTRQFGLALLSLAVLWLLSSALLRRLKAQEALLYTLRRAEAGFAQSGLAMLWLQPDGRIDAANGAAGRLLDSSPERLVRRHVSELFQGLDAEAWRRHWRQLQAEGVGHLELGRRLDEGAVQLLALDSSHVVVDGFDQIMVVLMAMDTGRQADLRLRQIFRHAREYLALFSARNEVFTLLEANRPRLSPGSEADPDDSAALGIGEDLQQVATVRLGLKPAQADFLQAMFRACVTAKRAMSFGASVDLGLGTRYHAISISPVMDEEGEVDALLVSLRDNHDQQRLLDALEQDLGRLQAELRERDRKAAG